ncbi:metallophosphoesterase family protein [Mammaliicoccus fleurettii]|uniref:metallophosphoesterase family protein n=1 Tax=Mammaliicoccus fleurettii TaxID=150056 RepID=UPI00099446F5|nr:metallophosphoesterase family protein [Mammaliicoccus fleurettii]MEB7725636.1 metallophosphatase family protein [Mammaliicoccus fleurettii]MEB8069037.1 metallophosphatase family protein [Mammaliicoccus fleurettii]OOV75316.1 metallophosphatase family protein [Mammaliicoccus fleurettii]
MVKFAILTDIHGNYDALTAVLTDIDNKKDIKHIYNLGDNIGVGHQTNEVLEVITNRDDMTYIAGNHDEAIMAVSNKEDYPESLKNKFYEHHQWIVEHLDTKYYNFLNNLQREVTQDIEGLKFYFTHYRILEENIKQHISDDPFEPIVEPSLEHVHGLFNGLDADFVTFGHNHVLHHFDDIETIYFNPGSVGLNNGAYAVYGIVEVKDGAINVERIKVPYDNQPFLDGFDEKAVPGKQLIFESFI